MEFGAPEILQASYLAGAAGYFIMGLASLNVKLPDFMWRMLVYGKLVDRDDNAKRQGSQGGKLSSILNVPKSWFLHYYVVAVLADSYGLWLVLTDECYASSQVLLGVLLLVNSARRLQESACVSVFSKATMNVIHYLLGMAYYMGRNYLAQHAMSTYYRQVTGDGQRSPSGALYSSTCWSLDCLDSIVLLLLVLSVYSMFMQHRALVELASLRSDPSLKNKHMIPVGSTFQRVSCPHYFWEIVLYTCFELLIAHYVHTVFHSFAAVYALVMVNQTLSAIETHRWYHSRFPDYPKERKAIIPYIL